MATCWAHRTRKLIQTQVKKNTSKSSKKNKDNRSTKAPAFPQPKPFKAAPPNNRRLFSTASGRLDGWKDLAKEVKAAFVAWRPLPHYWMVDGIPN